MFGLELAMTGLLHLAAAEVQCAPRKAPEITVVPSNSKIRYNFTKSQTDLDGFDIDTLSPYGPNKETHVGGLMEGEISVEHRIRFMQETYQSLDQGCLHIDTIDVKIHIDPIIYIASEHKEGSCKHDAILDHEKKHVRVDRITVNKYAKKIGKALQAELRSSGASYGPFSGASLPEEQSRIQEIVGDIIKLETNRMNQERRKKQQEVDSLEEYERIDRMCR